MSVYATGALFVGDKYVLLEGEEGKKWDALISTETYDFKNRLILEKMKDGKDPNLFRGFLFTPLAADFDQQDRLITVGIHGPLYGITIEDVEEGDKAMPASNKITDLFNGDGTAQQEINLSNIPVDSVISVKETTGPTTLTRVTNTPTSGQYQLNNDNGKLIIGGTSVSGTDNYEVIYNIDSARVKKCVERVKEDLATSTHVATATENIDKVNTVFDQGGNSKLIKYSGAPAAGEVTVDLTAGTFTFNATDAVTTATVDYETGYKPIGRFIKKQEAGEPAELFVDGGN